MFKSGIVVAFFTLLSRVFGLFREFFIAYSFGTTYLADSVNIAFRFPNLFRRVLGEGALSSVFIPIFSKKLTSGRQDAKSFAGNVFGLLFIALTLLILLLEIFMPYLMILLIPGFYQDQVKFDLAVNLCRISTPYIAFLSFVALFGGMLNSIGQFWALAFSPIIMSVTVIVFTYYFQDLYTAHYSIAYSLIVSGVLQCIFMVIMLWRAKLLFRVKANYQDRDVSSMLVKLGPAVLSSGTQQLGLFISQSIASFLPGAISVLAYADRIYQLPMALIGVTFGTILLPELSKLYENSDFQKTHRLQNIAIKIALLISVPASFGLYAIAEPITHLIYERGEFLRSDTLLTANALSVFAFGLPAFTLSKILTPIYYANLDTKTPLRISIYTLLVNSILNVILMIPFGIAGIAAGFTIASWYNLVLLNRGVRKFGNFQIDSGTNKFILRLLMAAVIMLIYVAFGYSYIREMFFSESVYFKIIAMFGMVISSVCVYAVSCVFFGLHKSLNYN